jgi:hypothetical protein
MAKKSVWLGMLVVLLALSMAVVGCATTKVVDAGRYDFTIPESSECELTIGDSKYPTVISRFDNQDVQWGGLVDVHTLDLSPSEELAAASGNLKLVYKIRIPAGQHTLTGAAVGISLKETSTKYDFVAGKAYSVFVMNGNFQIKEISLP